MYDVRAWTGTPGESDSRICGHCSSHVSYRPLVYAHGKISYLLMSKSPERASICCLLHILHSKILRSM